MDKDLTKGSIIQNLWSLAWPMMLSVFFYTLYNLVDAYWVSKISPEAIAAVSISQITLFIMISLGFGITVGSGVIMAMDIGAKRIDAAERVLGQSFVLATLAGVLFTGLSLLLRNQLLVASGAAGDVFPLAYDYFTITAGGSILFFILITIMFAFNSQGDTFTLTKLFALSTLVNLLLDPLLIFGWQGIPAMGISGAAIATLISQAVFIVIALVSLSSAKRHIRFHFKNLSFRWHSVKKVLKIGIPAALTQVINPIGMAALMVITTMGFMEAGSVAFSLGFRVEFFAYLPAVGFGFAGMSLISQNLGAKNLDRAKESFRTALLFGFLGATALGLLAILFAKPLIAVFTTDPLVTKYTLTYLWIIGLSYGLLAAAMVESTAFQAMGKSWPGFWIFFIRFLIIAVPMSYILTQYFSFSIEGIWFSILASNIIAAIIGYFWINRALNHYSIEETPVDTQ